MTTVAETESRRLSMQCRLDQRKTAKERNRWGQFATPPQLSLQIACYARERLKRRGAKLAFLDPAVGTGSFFSAFIQAFREKNIARATGVELDEEFAAAAQELWQEHGLTVLHGDFTKQQPNAAYNLILTNPPYVRHHHLTPDEKQRLTQLALEITGVRLSGLSGLYCYFLLIAHRWLSDDGLAIWLIPSEFMDVNYGKGVKQYLMQQVTLIQVHRFCPADVQFEDALVSSAIIVFEKRRPKPGHEVVFSFGGTLAAPAESERVSLDQLLGTPKWTGFAARATNSPGSSAVLLGDLFAVKRGLATGNNNFFIIPRERLDELGIPVSCVRPILPSPRFLKQEIVVADEDGWPIVGQQLALIDCRFPEDEISRQWPHFAEYLAEGKRIGVHEGYLTKRRSPWYAQEKREPAPFVCTYMGRNRERPFRFIWNRSRAVVANVYLALYPKPRFRQRVTENASQVFRALQAIHAEHFLTQGRVYGGGLHKMEPAELMRLPADSIADILHAKPDQQKRLFG